MPLYTISEQLNATTIWSLVEEVYAYKALEGKLEEDNFRDQTVDGRIIERPISEKRE
jgi:hypothetical protein